VPRSPATTGPLASDEVLDDSTSNPVRLLAKGEVTRAAFLRDVGRPPGNAATQVTKAPKKRPQRPAVRHADIARHPKAHSQHEEPDQGHPEPAIGLTRATFSVPSWPTMPAGGRRRSGVGLGLQRLGDVLG
jgi:hypothetical protein